MKNLIFILLLFIIGCSSTNLISSNKVIASKISDTIRIANDFLEYEVIIIDDRFN